MAATQKPDLLPEPTSPEDWECCNSECGDACIHEIYRREKAAYNQQQRELAHKNSQIKS